MHMYVYVCVDALIIDSGIIIYSKGKKGVKTQSYSM